MTQKESIPMTESNHVINVNNLKKARDFGAAVGANMLTLSVEKF